MIRNTNLGWKIVSGLSTSLAERPESERRVCAALMQCRAYGLRAGDIWLIGMPGAINA